ncbi:exocyst complex component Sec10-domain-containing protein [Exophiala viscosa]|uniref:exocyst complex component Sec10-domain-containing protein n=1 Tax=Exophiala viscosa TaxID=2486360 RepID=UPI00219811F1|nr:exocyst complex component Sec10-domain-containing protein [Exophiala viscosa]
MSRVKRPIASGKPLRRDPLASLKLADMLISKPTLPAEILTAVVDYLDVPDLLRFARTSRRMHDMVYDDARWVYRLRKMDCWNEADARKRKEPGKTPITPGGRPSRIEPNLVNGKGRPEVLFDVDSSPVVQRRHSSLLSPLRPRQAAADGFDVAELATPRALISPGLPVDPAEALSVFQRVKSVRGQARQEYGRIYRLLAPYYIDLYSASQPMGSRIFKDFSVPEQQAQLLANVRTFSASDFSPESGSRARRIMETVERFDTAALLEFRQGYEYKDIRGQMRQYARVMHILNGGKSGVDLFLHDNKLINQKAALGSVSDCIDYSLGHGELSLEKVNAYFGRLGDALSQENSIVEAVFPNAREVSLLLLEEVAKEILAPFLSHLFEDAQTRSTSTYLRIISGTFAATSQFIEDSALEGAEESTVARRNAILAQIYGQHLEKYLTEELAFFRQKADAEVERWDRALSEQAASTESYLMSNVNRQADKKDFMSTFKQVLMMPVNILPSFSGASSVKPAAKTHIDGVATVSSRPSTPNPSAIRAVTPSFTPEAPTNELAAKAAIMNTKLENIRSLFSIEIALNLVHAAKSSLERAAQFTRLAGEPGESARKQCSAIFVLLLHSVGVRHVKAGFDKAINHLSNYNPRDTNSNSDTDTVQVAPLVTFLELVNVGDLIQQMLDVFYESELVRLGISKRDDFLDVNIKEKRKFEAMLDERVAAGLGKGIDALMDEAEYICATTQLPTDFYPELAHADATNGTKPGANAMVMDFSGQPTTTASRVIALVSHHTGMLTGATEKTLLDVFTAEVGLRLFSVLTKHIKRQRISTLGALALLSDLTAYANFVAQFKNNDLISYYTALREVAQIYLIGGESERDVAEMATIISDAERYKGVFTVEEVVEFAERRSDWLLVKGRVEGKVKGDGCVVM